MHLHEPGEQLPELSDRPLLPGARDPHAARAGVARDRTRPRARAPAPFLFVAGLVLGGGCSGDPGPTGAPHPDDFFPTVDFTKIEARFTLFEEIRLGGDGGPDTTTRVRATFFDALGVPVGFSGSVAVNDTLAVLRGPGTYEAILGAASPGREYRFVVRQKNLAPIGNGVRMPARRMEITTPAAGADVIRAEGLRVTWLPPADDSTQVSLYVTGRDGAAHLLRRVADDGEHRYTTADLLDAPPGDLYLSASRFRTREPSGFLKGSSVSGAFVRSVLLHFPPGAPRSRSVADAASGEAGGALTLRSARASLAPEPLRISGLLPRAGRTAELPAPTRERHSGSTARGVPLTRTHP